MILKPLWKSLDCMFPVGSADVKISVRPSLAGCEAVNSNNQQDHELNLWVTNCLTVCACVCQANRATQTEEEEELTKYPHTLNQPNVSSAAEI